MRAEFALFKINGTTEQDLHPDEGRYIAVLRWWYPARQAGLAAGPSARELYGPLKIAVNAVDTPPSTRIFSFDYDRQPMIFDDEQEDAP